MLSQASEIAITMWAVVKRQFRVPEGAWYLEYLAVTPRIGSGVMGIENP
jgi:hypothetical protein